MEAYSVTWWGEKYSPWIPDYWNSQVSEICSSSVHLVVCYQFTVDSTVCWTAVPLIYYGLQHYLSLAGSLIFIPLIIVPTMGGTDVSICSQFFPYECIKCWEVTLVCICISRIISFILLQEDTATVISTMLLVSGITTILHSYFGTRLPLVQGSSFVYLAPALVIINSEEFRNLTEHVS